jgi:hypothetical protein
VTLTLDSQVVSANYSCSANDTVILAKTNISGYTITLPVASGQEGRVIIIKDTKGSASINNLIIEPQSPETIDDYSSITFQSDYGSIILAASGSSPDSGWTVLSIK